MNESETSDDEEEDFELEKENDKNGEIDQREKENGESRFDESDENGDECDEEEQIFVLHSYQNDRQNHMISQSEPNCLTFPVSYKPSIEKV